MTIVGSALAQITQGGSEQPWADRLHAASFRGVPFAVISGESQSGRRQAVHEYPMRDQVWVEDLGRGTRRITLQGFIVQDSRIYGGGDVIAQRDSLVAASEAGGAGTLVHPTLGELTVNIPDGGLKVREGMDQGRSFSFSLTCIESGLKTFALTTGGTPGSIVEQSWFSTVTTAAAAIIAEVNGEILSIKHAATTIQNTIGFWSSFISDTAREATTLASSLRSTLGNLRFGRDCNGSAGGSISGLTGKITSGSGAVDYSALVTEKTAQVIAARTTIDAHVAELSEMSEISVVPAAVEALITTLMDAVPSTQDRLRLLELMMSESAFDGTYYNDTTSNRVFAALQAYLKIMAAAMFARVAASASLTGTVAAQELLNRGIAALDTACLLASEHGNDELWKTLEQLREDFTESLTSEGLNAVRVTWSFPSSLPALNMANRIWQDASYGDALIVSASPIHPAFMPLSVEVINDE
ncbi:DNA circularization N-terminal domain-containing protein [Pantoea agglomerans pv. betae]|uniref:DNA circularization N-terminal domain-containing protein n=1 Tax=Enterobacter agglomerans TaxID=549 RepID=UPI0007E581CA|nr:DNA circularization N-terminal domain-containing protein [Pantoea agglomerans]WHU82976.1 DNA circularization N-terminal domain-containing protein [Pantoea agglomerans pv. betae]